MPVAPPAQPRRASKLNLLLDKLALKVSSARYIDGIWVGAFCDKRSFPDLFQPVEQALLLIKQHDRVRYNHLVRDIDRIWVHLLPGNLGEYNNALKLCALDERFILADTTRPDQIAATIVHEACHARLMRCGIGYESQYRARVEAVCFRRERAFAARLPAGELPRDEAERRLTGYPPDFWTAEAFRNRRAEGHAENLRYLGSPEFVIRVVFRCRALLWRIKHLLHRQKPPTGL